MGKGGAELQSEVGGTHFLYHRRTGKTLFPDWMSAALPPLLRGVLRGRVNFALKVTQAESDQQVPAGPTRA